MEILECGKAGKDLGYPFFVATFGHTDEETGEYRTYQRGIYAYNGQEAFDIACMHASDSPVRLVELEGNEE